MPTRFFATQFAVVEEDDVLITALGAPASEGDGLYLTLQLGLSPTTQDVALCQDGPYLEYCTQAWSWYGEIELFELFRDHVVATMSSRAAQRMGNDGVIEVDFDLSPAQFAELKGALERTFQGRSLLVLR